MLVLVGGVARLDPRVAVIVDEVPLRKDLQRVGWIVVCVMHAVESRVEDADHDPLARESALMEPDEVDLR